MSRFSRWLDRRNDDAIATLGGPVINAPNASESEAILLREAQAAAAEAQRIADVAAAKAAEAAKIAQEAAVKVAEAAKSRADKTVNQVVDTVKGVDEMLTGRDSAAAAEESKATAKKIGDLQNKKNPDGTLKTPEKLVADDKALVTATKQEIDKYATTLNEQKKKYYYDSKLVEQCDKRIEALNAASAKMAGITESLDKTNQPGQPPTPLPDSVRTDVGTLGGQFASSRGINQLTGISANEMLAYKATEDSLVFAAKKLADKVSFGLGGEVVDRIKTAADEKKLLGKDINTSRSEMPKLPELPGKAAQTAEAAPMPRVVDEPVPTTEVGPTPRVVEPVPTPKPVATKPPTEPEKNTSSIKGIDDLIKQIVGLFEGFFAAITGQQTATTPSQQTPSTPAPTPPATKPAAAPPQEPTPTAAPKAAPAASKETSPTTSGSVDIDKSIQSVINALDIGSKIVATVAASTVDLAVALNGPDKSKPLDKNLVKAVNAVNGFTFNTVANGIEIAIKADQAVDKIPGKIASPGDWGAAIKAVADLPKLATRITGGISVGVNSAIEAANKSIPTVMATSKESGLG